MSSDYLSLLPETTSDETEEPTSGVDTNPTTLLDQSVTRPKTKAEVVEDAAISKLERLSFQEEQDRYIQTGETTSSGSFTGEVFVGAPDEPIEQLAPNIWRNRDGSFKVLGAEGTAFNVQSMDAIPEILKSEARYLKDLGKSKNPIVDTALGTAEAVQGIYLEGKRAIAYSGPTNLEEGAKALQERQMRDWMNARAQNPTADVPKPVGLTDEDISKYREIKEAQANLKELTPEQNSFVGSETFSKLEGVQKEVDNTYQELQAIEDSRVDWSRKYDNQMMDLALKDAEKEGGTWGVVKKAFEDPGYFIKAGIESVPYMLALTAGGAITQGAVLLTYARSLAAQNTLEFKKENNGREPTPEEQVRIDSWSAIQAASEKYADMALMGKLKVLNRMTGNLTKKLPPSLQFLSKPALGIGAEGLGGAATEASKQMAVSGDITDTAAIKIAGVTEALATPSGYGSAAVAKGVGSSLTKERFNLNNIDSKIAETETQLNIEAPALTQEEIIDRQQMSAALGEKIEKLGNEATIEKLNEWKIDKLKADTELQAGRKVYLDGSNEVPKATQELLARHGMLLDQKAQLTDTQQIKEAKAEAKAARAEARAEAKAAKAATPSTTLRQKITNAAATVKGAVSKTAEAARSAADTAINPEKSWDVQAEELEANPADRVNLFVQVGINQRAAEGKSSREIATEGQQLVSEMMDYIQDLPEDLGPKEQAHIKELVTTINAYKTAADIGIKPAPTKEKLLQIITDFGNKTKVSKSAVDDVLYSMKTGFTVSVEDAESIADSEQLSDAQKAEVKEYIRRAKSLQEVGIDVQSGQDSKFTGFTVRAKNIVDAVASEDFGFAQQELTKLTNFGKYQALKIKAFDAVLAHRAGEPAPAELTDVTFKENGTIDRFRVANDFGMGTQQDSFYFRNAGALNKLKSQVQGELTAIRSQFASLKTERDAIKANATQSEATETVAATEAAPEQQPVTEAAQEPTQPDLFNQEEVTLDDVVAEQQEAQEAEKTTAKPAKAKTQGVKRPSEAKQLKINGIDVYIVPKGTINLRSLAATTVDENSIPYIVMQEGLTKKDVLSYLVGHVADTADGKNKTKATSLASAQKAVVTKFMQDEYGVDLLDQIGGMSDQEVRKFIIRHELDHIKNNDRSVYYDDKEQTIAKKYKANDSENKFLADSAIRIEARANLNALKAAGLGKPKAKPSNRAQAVSKAVTGVARKTKTFAKQAGFSLKKTLLAIRSTDVGERTLASMFTIADTKKAATDVAEEHETAYQDSKSEPVLRIVEDFFKQFKEGTTGLEFSETANSLLGRVASLNDRVANTLNNNLELIWNKDFEGLLGTKANFKANLYDENYALFLVDKESGKQGSMDPNVIAAITVAITNWIGAEANSTLFNDNDAINRIIGKPEGSSLSSGAKKLRTAGIPLNQAVETMGQQVMAQLGLKAKKDVKGNVDAKMQAALGVTAAMVAEQLGLLQINQITRKDLGTEVVGEAPTALFIKGITDDKNQLAGTTKVISDLYRTPDANGVSLRTVLDELFGLATAIRFPSFSRKVLDDKATYLRSNTVLPEQHRRDVNYAQSVPWSFKGDLEVHLEKPDRDFLRALYRSTTGSGYVADTDAVPLDVRADVIAMNQEIDREIDNLLEFYKQYKANDSKTFFFDYAVWANGRTGITSADFNPQNSKLVRHFIKPYKHKVKLRTDNPDYVQALKYAVALGFGINTDKDTPASVMKDLAVIEKGPWFEKARKNIANGRSNKSIKRFVTQFDSPAHALDALVAYDSYLTAKEKGEHTFETDLANEADAVTSGVILGLLAAGIKDTKKLEAGGVFFSSAYDSYSSWRIGSGELRPDNYQQLVDPWKKAANESSRNLSPKQREIVRNYIAPFIGSLSRSHAKSPVMVVNYGAGIAATVESFINGQVNKIYEDLADPKKQAKTLEMLQQLGLPANFDPINNRIPRKVIKNFEGIVRDSYGVGLATALESFNKRFSEYQSAVNTGVNAISWAFQAKYDLMRDKLVKEKGLKSVYELSKDDLVGIMTSEEMKPFLPMIKYPDSKTRYEGGTFIKRERVYPNNDPTKAQVKFSKKGTPKSYSRTSRVAIQEYTDPGVSGLVKMIQSMDDKTIRSLLGSTHIMSAFDAHYSSIIESRDNSQTYNKAVIETTKNYSPATVTLEALREVLKSIKWDELVVYLKSHINKNNITISSDEKLLAMVKANASNKEVMKEIVSDLARTVRNEKARKPKMFDAMVGIDHNPSNATYTAINLNEQEDSLDTVVSDAADDILKSADRPIPEDEFVIDEEHAINPESIVTIFDRLKLYGAAKASAQHRNKLADLLENVVSPAIARLEPHRLKLMENNEAALGWLENKEVFIAANASRLTSNLEMSSQEIYAHELVHAITKAAIANPKNGDTVASLVRLQKQARNHLNKKYNGDGWKVFLKTDASGNPIYLANKEAEIEIAKEQFAYVFTDLDEATVHYTDADGYIKSTEQLRALLEFVAIGATNEQLNNALADMEFRKDGRPEQATFFGKLEAFLLKLADSVFKALGRDPIARGDKALISMIQELNRAHTKQVFHTRGIMKILSDGNTVVGRKFIQYVATPLGRYNYNLFTKVAGRPGAIKQVVGMATVGVGTVFPPRDIPEVPVTTFEDALDDTRLRANKAKKGLVYDLLRMIVASKDPFMSKLEWMLLKSKNLIDLARERVIDATRAEIDRRFRTTVSEEEYQALTLGLLQTDINSLFDKATRGNASTLVKYLRNTGNARELEIKRIKDLLETGYGRQGNYYVAQARSLGSIMSKGEALVADTGMNAYVISRGTLLEEQFPNRELDQAEALIDQLATLYSIRYLTDNTRNTTADVIEREFAASTTNGIQFMLELHKGFKAKSLAENFDGNKAMVTKGWIKQTFNPHVEVRVGTAEDAAEFAKENFVRIGKVSKDSVDSSGNKYIYVNDAAGLGKYNKAILSLTSEQVAGSSIRNGKLGLDSGVTSTSAAREVKRIKEANKRRVARQFASSSYIDPDAKLMIPSVNESGQIHDYRYMMNQTTRINVMGQKLNGADVLARMMASIKDKTETKRINREAVDAMHADYLKNFKTNPADFTEIKADSPNPEVQEMYKMMPKDARLYAKQKYGNSPFLVRTEALSILYGHRKVAAAKNHHRKVWRVAEGVWKEIVSFAKTNIVIKNPAVIFGNILSNTFAGLIRGVPIEQMVSGQLKGIKLLNRYQQQLTQLEKLDAQLIAAKAANRSTTNILADIATLRQQINSSEIKPLIDAGLFQTIVEDVDVKTDSDGYIKEFYDKYKVKLPAFLQKSAEEGKVKVATDWAFITRDTGAFKLLMKGTQYSDFVARYAMFDYLTKQAPGRQRLTQEKALRIVLDLFINYEAPTNKYLQYMDEMGLLIFLKYPTRIIRAIYNAFKNNPLNAFGLLLAEATVDPSTPYDARVLGVWDPSTSLDMVVDSATTVPLTQVKP